MRFTSFFRYHNDSVYIKFSGETKGELRTCWKQNVDKEKLDLLIVGAQEAVNWVHFWQHNDKRATQSTSDTIQQLDDALYNLDSALVHVSRDSVASSYVSSELLKEYKGECEAYVENNEEGEGGEFDTHVSNLKKSIAGLQAGCEQAKKGHNPKPGRKRNLEYFFVEYLLSEYVGIFGKKPGLGKPGPFSLFAKVAGDEVGLSVSSDLVNKIIRDSEN